LRTQVQLTWRLLPGALEPRGHVKTIELPGQEQPHADHKYDTPLNFNRISRITALTTLSGSTCFRQIPANRSHGTLSLLSESQPRDDDPLSPSQPDKSACEAPCSRATGPGWYLYL